MRAAVEILVLDGDEAFVEQRVALTRDLHPVAERLRLLAARPRRIVKRWRLVVAYTPAIC